MALYRDRQHAAAVLFGLLPPAVGRDWHIVGLARGGVPVAAHIAKALGASLGVLIVRKVGLPANPELALAAVTGPGAERRVVNDTVRRLYGISTEEVERLCTPAVEEVRRRQRLWQEGAAEHGLAGRRVLLVDDGMATGTTMLAAIGVARQSGATQVGVAVPVALGQSLRRLPAGTDPVICPVPEFSAAGVGAAYDSFLQVSDGAVRDLLRDMRRGTVP